MSLYLFLLFISPCLADLKDDFSLFAIPTLKISERISYYGQKATR